MKIAIDAMGGDCAPAEIIKGAVDGARQYDVGIVLVGPQNRIREELTKYDTRGLEIEIVHTDEYLDESEHAAFALRSKRKASIMMAVKLVRDRKAAAAVGAGPTGGVIAAAFYALGTMEGLSRPVIGGPFLGFTPNSIMIDLGGNVDSRPDQLFDFGIIGTVYARKWMNISNPSIALVSNGKEEGKGNDVIKEAYGLFQKSGLNFIGNVEGNDVALGTANIFICDGLIGNVIVKFCEGLGTTITTWMKNALNGRLPGDEIDKLIEKFARKTIPADFGGGGPLWGINGIVCKAHGRSKAREVAMTVGNAKRAVELDLVNVFKSELSAIRNKIEVP